MMRVHEAWSPEYSQLIFRGQAAVTMVRAAVDAAYENPDLREPEIATLIELAGNIDDCVAKGETREFALKKGHMEADLVHQGLTRIVRKSSPANSPALPDYYRAWKASRLIGKIARATI